MHSAKSPPVPSAYLGAERNPEIMEAQCMPGSEVL